MALTNLTQTSYDAMLKEIYTPKRVANLATKKRPLLRMLKKVDDLDGDNYVCPVQYELPGGVSSTFTTAQANGVPSKYVKWNASVKAKYMTNGIDALTLRSSRKNKGAFARARKKEVDGMLRALGRSASIALYRDGVGTIGVVDQASFATAVLTLETSSDAANFAVSMVCQFVEPGTPALRDSGDTLDVVSVQESAGTVTFDANLSDIAAIADADKVIKAGDFNIELTGLEAHFPLTAPTSGDSHFGVDRSVHAARLAGQRLNKPTQRIEESIMELAELCNKADGEPDVAMISHENYTRMVKSIGTPEYTNADRQANVGFRGVMIHTSAGTVEVYADPDCPKNRGYVLQMDTLVLHHLDPFPHIDQIDGLMALRQSAGDGLEVRARYWAELLCDAPAWNGVFAIST